MAYRYISRFCGADPRCAYTYHLKGTEKEKCDKLKASGINLTEELKGDLIKMCNYSERVALNAANKAYAKGETKGAYKEQIKAAQNFFAHGFSVHDVQEMYPDLAPELLVYLKDEAAEKKTK